MPLFRCLNDECSEVLDAHPEFDFENEDGKCPRCGRTHRDAPRVVVARVAVHYLVNDPKGLIRTANGNRSIACQPTVRRLDGRNQCTGVREAVTCPKCMETAVFKQHETDQVDQDIELVKPGTGAPI